MMTKKDLKLIANAIATAYENCEGDSQEARLCRLAIKDVVMQVQDGLSWNEYSNKIIDYFTEETGTR